jgi:hypothetical protein
MRLVVFILNGIFLFVGSVFIICGFFLEIEYAQFEHATQDAFGWTPAGIIIVGAFMIRDTMCQNNYRLCFKWPPDWR